MESHQENQRARAAAARRLAKSVTDPQIRAQLEMAAQDYDEMVMAKPARQSRRRSRARPPHRV